MASALVASWEYDVEVGVWKYYELHDDCWWMLTRHSPELGQGQGKSQWQEWCWCHESGQWKYYEHHYGCWWLATHFPVDVDYYGQLPVSAALLAWSSKL